MNSLGQGKQLYAGYCKQYNAYLTDAGNYTFVRSNYLEATGAQESMDAARQKFVSQLYEYWYDYYQLRSLTLWDFTHTTDIDAYFEKLVKD